MRGGEALQDLIRGVLEHAEMEALLEEVENSSGSKAATSAECADHGSQ